MVKVKLLEDMEGELMLLEWFKIGFILDLMIVKLNINKIHMIFFHPLLYKYIRTKNNGLILVLNLLYNFLILKKEKLIKFLK
jgi:hypothetical protein